MYAIEPVDCMGNSFERNLDLVGVSLSLFDLFVGEHARVEAVLFSSAMTHH